GKESVCGYFALPSFLSPTEFCLNKEAKKQTRSAISEIRNNVGLRTARREMNSLIAHMLLLLVLKNAHSQLIDCGHFSDNLPLRLRELRTTFNKIKDYFQDRDSELDTMLLKQDLLEDFKTRIESTGYMQFHYCPLKFFQSYLGCQSVGEMIHFYLEDVLPKVTTDNPVKQDVDFLGNMLLDLRQLIKRCHRFFICERKNKTVKAVKDTYEKLRDKGIYKAIGEFDIFVDYIEQYLLMKMKN
ncbi:Interleukin-10, partial [Ophiophagus hannah]